MLAITCVYVQSENVYEFAMNEPSNEEAFTAFYIRVSKIYEMVHHYIIRLVISII